jgi:hypothetical protein
MDPESKQWRTLCIAAAFEEDPQKLAQIVADLNTELSNRQQQLADAIFAGLAENPPLSREGKGWIQ